MAGCTGFEGVDFQRRTCPDRPSTFPDLPAPLPSLRLVPSPIAPDAARDLPAVTSDLFVQAAAVAAQRCPCRRGDLQGAHCVAVQRELLRDRPRAVRELYGKVMVVASGGKKRSLGQVAVPADTATGSYVVTVTAEDMAHNVSSTQVALSVVGR